MSLLPDATDTDVVPGERREDGEVDFQDVIRRRRMIRDYQDRPLEQDVVERIVGNGLRAPSAGFSQGWAFLVLQDAADRERFWRVAGEQDWLERHPTMRVAPLLVVPLSHKETYLDQYATPEKGWADRDETRWPVPYWDIDTGMAALLMLLSAVDAGLGRACSGSCPARWTGSEQPSACQAGTPRSEPSASATDTPTLLRRPPDWPLLAACPVMSCTGIAGECPPGPAATSRGGCAQRDLDWVADRR